MAPPGRTARALALLLALAALPAAAGLGACQPAAPFDALRALQDDAGSGRDAGDCDALAVPLRHDGYHWGTLDPPLPQEGLDANDWYAIHFERGQAVMASVAVNVNSTVPYMLLAHVPTRLEVWPPGAASAVGATTSCAGAVRFDSSPGVWRLRVAASPLPGTGPCAPSAPDYPPPPLEPAQARQSYGVYFGCNPHCYLAGD